MLNCDPWTGVCPQNISCLIVDLQEGFNPCLVHWDQRESKPHPLSLCPSSMHTFSFSLTSSQLRLPSLPHVEASLFFSCCAFSEPLLLSLSSHYRYYHTLVEWARRYKKHLHFCLTDRVTIPPGSIMCLDHSTHPLVAQKLVIITAFGIAALEEKMPLNMFRALHLHMHHFLY